MQSESGIQQLGLGVAESVMTTASESVAVALQEVRPQGSESHSRKVGAL